MADGPWTQYQQAPAQDGPWKKYAAPAAQKDAAKEGPLPSWQKQLVTEPFMKAVTGVAGTAVGGLRTLAGTIFREPEAVDKGQELAEKLTYEPKSELGQGTSKVLEYPGRKLGEVADVAGRKAAEVTGSPAVGAVVNTGIQAAAQALLGKGAGVAGEAVGLGEKGAAAAGVATRPTTTLQLAKDFATTKLGTKWEDLPPGVQKRLKTAARDPAELAKIDPKHVEVEARAERMDMPVTRGQVTRNPSQLGSENRMAKVEGNPVSPIKAAQDEALHGALDDVRKSTGGAAETRSQVGKSVQDDALRKKVAASKSDYDKAFADARATEPNATVSPEPFYKMLEKDPDIQHEKWMESWLNRAKAKTVDKGGGIEVNPDIEKAKKDKGKPAPDKIEFRPLKLTELHDLREKAGAIAKHGQGSDKYYAQQVVDAIDKAYQKIPAAAKAWRAAYDKFIAHKVEFDDQAIVNKLSTNKTRTDRSIDLADTTDTVIGHSAEDIAKLKKSLTEGGTPETRAAGDKAWRDVQAGVIDYLREKAHGRRANVNENRTDEFNAAFRDAFSELEKDGKIDVIFDKKQAAKLRAIYKAVGDVRTEPSKRIPGSDTAQNLEAQKVENTLSALEKVAKFPVVGPTISGTVDVARHVWDYGAGARRSARAKTTPLMEAAETAKRKRAKVDKKRRDDRNTLKSLKRGSSVARLTLRDQDQNQQQ